jgi:hypothetical protein
MKSVTLQLHSEYNTLFSNHVYCALYAAFSLLLVQSCQTSGQKKSVIQAENTVNDYGRDSNMSMQPKTGCFAYP